MINWNNFQELLSAPMAKKKLSEATGISTGNISDWFNPNKQAHPNADALVKIANYFECSVDYLLGRTDIKELSKQSDNTIRFIDMGEIIYIDTYLQPVSAGKGNIYIDDAPVSKLYPSTTISSKAAYCVRISGDSMYPYYLNGDIIYVDNKAKNLNNGDIGIFIYDGEAYCKEYYENDGNIKLISLNPDQERYNPIIIQNDTFEVEGKVIGKFHAD